MRSGTTQHPQPAGRRTAAGRRQAGVAIAGGAVGTPISVAAGALANKTSRAANTLMEMDAPWPPPRRRRHCRCPIPDSAHTRLDPFADRLKSRRSGMAVITISRHPGSLGDTVARAVAERLRYRIVERD